MYKGLIPLLISIFLFGCRNKPVEPLPFQLFPPQNQEKKVPLVVYLHGIGGSGTDVKTHLTEIPWLSQHPENRPEAWYYFPQSPDLWEVNRLEAVARGIEGLIADKNIDTSRLYLIGFSMGGSKVVKLAEIMKKSYGRDVAAIVRLSGQDRYRDKTYKTIAATRINMFIGLGDDERRIEVARREFQQLQKLHGGTVEEENILVDGHRALRKKLMQDSNTMALYTELPDDGHMINDFPWKDGTLIDWLFTQQLSK